MHFGRVSNVEGIRFDPPPLDPRNIAALGGRRAGNPRLFIGAPVWSVPSWTGEVYPVRTPQRKFLLHYAHRYPTVEMNSTFYSVPSVDRLRTWRETVPAQFRFCPKVPRDASHTQPGRVRDAALEAFAETLHVLGDRVGLPFLQLPPKIAPSARAQVRTLVERLPPGKQPAIEFRHPGWFADGRLDEETFAWLHEAGLPVVVSDVAGRRDVLHGSLPAPRVVVRFGGNRLHPTDYRRIHDWATTLVGWFEIGLEDAYFFVHQPDDVHAPRLIAALEEEIGAIAPELLASVPALPAEPPRDGQLPLL